VKIIDKIKYKPKMKTLKVFALVSILALTSCGGSNSSTENATDNTEATGNATSNSTDSTSVATGTVKTDSIK